MSNSIITPSVHDHAEGDQASVLRELVSRRAALHPARSTMTRGCHTIVVAGGKGGVGRSVVALNLAILLSQRGGRVGLLDACPDLGSIELLCGLNGYWNLSHVLQGCRQVDEVVLAGPAAVKIVSGANCLLDLSSESANIPQSVTSQLRSFERKLDWLIIDAGGTSSDSTAEFAAAADDVLIVTTPEPTAVAEAYASVKSLASCRRPRLGLLVNHAASVAQAQQILDRLQQAAHAFLQIDLHRRGYIPRDAAVATSVSEQVPFSIAAPESAATAALRKLTQRWTRLQPANIEDSFISRLCGDSTEPLLNSTEAAA